MAVGEHLEAADQTAAIVVVGGSALSVRGWVDRVTKDVDVIALAAEEDGRRILVSAQPLPEHLLQAVRRVARDYSLADDWMNSVIGAQWKLGLPRGFEQEIQWRRFHALEVGFAGRNSIIALKLFATVDQGRESVHSQDLVRLHPTESELRTAAEWVRGQDAGEAFPALLEETLGHVRDSLAGRHRGSS
ncbi:MAG: DUF6036 family nucleotidyltransferase [Gemmatimonadota bacterium]